MAATSFATLPEGIVTMPPGAQLGAALGSVDPTRVAPRDTATLLAASRRQLSHTEALHAQDRRRSRAREALARFPSAALRRWIEQRDRTCCFRPCGATASGCDIDHTIEVIAGGLTVPINLGPACGHDHHAKGPGGWQVRQDRPGHFTWTSPTGNDYASGTPKIVPDLPYPLPREQQGYSDFLPRELADHGPLWHNNPYPPPETPPDAPPDDPDDPYPEKPPF